MEFILVPVGLGCLLGGAFLEDRARRQLRRSYDHPILAALPDGAQDSVRDAADGEARTARARSRWLFLVGGLATLALAWF